jgi:hypothetical protein
MWQYVYGKYMQFEYINLSICVCVIQWHKHNSICNYDAIFGWVTHFMCNEFRWQHMSLSFLFKIQYYKWHWIFQQLFDVIAYATIVSIVAPSSIYPSTNCGHMDSQDLFFA